MNEAVLPLLLIYDMQVGRVLVSTPRTKCWEKISFYRKKKITNLPGDNWQ